MSPYRMDVAKQKIWKVWRFAMNEKSHKTVRGVPIVVTPGSGATP